MLMFIDKALTQLRQLRQDRSVYMVQIIIAVAIIIDYSIYETLSNTIGNYFYILPVMLIVPSLFLPVGDYTTPRAQKLLLVLYHVIAAIILVFLADIFGPYFQLLNLLLFTSAIWYGAKGTLISLGVSYLTVVTAYRLQFSGALQSELSQLVLYLIGLTVLAILFERVTYYHKSEINEHQRVNQDYYFERTRLLSLINSMADAVIATDKQSRVLLYNGAALELLNTNVSLYEQPLGHLLEFYDKNSNKPLNIIAETSKSRGPLRRDDVYFKADDGSEVDINISISPITNPGIQREQLGFIMVMQDITKQKTLDEQRDEFISIASHELRTPVAIAEANISTALMPKFSNQLNAEGRKLLNQAHENVMFLSNLVNDLYILAQAEQGRLEVSTANVSPQKLLKKMYDNHLSQVEDKGLDLKLEIDENIESITTNLDALKEILQNFITNALKYTESGHITLSAKPDKDNEGVIFAVKDTGIGISAADQKHVFEKFYRSEDYRTQQNGGTGLGLYISKRLADRMGGEIWFESKLNKGSVFYCRLPLKAEIAVNEPGND